MDAKTQAQQALKKKRHARIEDQRVEKARRQMTSAETEDRSYRATGNSGKIKSRTGILEATEEQGHE